MSDLSTTLREARDRYFADNGFGENGGYDDAWVVLKFGPVPFPIPNTQGRVRAVRFHDLHHVLTGYGTDLRGEAEIGAWELAAGCADFVAAWQLNFVAMAGGLFLAPRRTWRAFIRGLRSTSFYAGYDYDDALLAKTVAGGRELLGVVGEAGEPIEANARDALKFAACSLAALVSLSLFLVLSIPLALFVGLPSLVVRSRARAECLRLGARSDQ